MSQTFDAAFFGKVPVFSGLEGHRLERLVGMLDEHRFEAGEVVFNEGEMGQTMYVLCEGEVDVLRTNSQGKHVSIVRLGPGEVFGEMALVEQEPRSATVVARKKSKALSLTNPDLYHLYHDDNYACVLVLQNICRLLSRRLRKADSRICEFMSKSPAPRASKPKPTKRAARSRR